MRGSMKRGVVADWGVGSLSGICRVFQVADRSTVGPCDRNRRNST
jgi:hypothetical protein